MLSGRRYRLRNPTLALDFVEGRYSALTIPAGAIIEVVSGPAQRNAEALVKIRYQARPVQMFAIDVEMRGELLPGEGAAT
jgi:hypothetical protein